MRQGVLPFQYVQARQGLGMTALAGLLLYLELAETAGLPESIRKHVGLRKEGQGWTDEQMVMALVMLNLAGGEAVQDLEVLERDEGFCAVLRKVESWGLRRRERREWEGRWRKEQRRSVPSESATFRYLARFHDGEEEKRRQPNQAFIPAANGALQGLRRVNADLVAFVQKRAPQAQATLDMDATLVETWKEGALFSYKGYKAYQPLNTYWAEQRVMVHSEFRDGNVPAGYEQRRVLAQALELLPCGVEQVLMRSDTAGYQQELLRFCAEGKDQRFGVIPFAVGVDVTEAFRQAVREVPEEAWQPLQREGAGERQSAEQEWAEVCFVPNWVGHRKGSPEYRYLAVREPVRHQVLPGMEEQLPFSPVVLGEGRRYKVTGVVTNRDLPGDEVIWWYRQRCGKSEEAHAIMKEDLAGGKLPSQDFGENAAWWAIMLLAFNLHQAMERLVLETGWWGKRLKAVRFGLISLPGRVVRHGGQLLLQVAEGHPAFSLLIRSRSRMLAWAHAAPN